MSRIGLENPLLTQFIHRLTESYPFHLLPFVSSLIPLIISFFLLSQRRIISIQLSESHLFYLFSLLSLNLSYQSIMPTVLSSQLIILLFLGILVFSSIMVSASCSHSHTTHSPIGTTPTTVYSIHSRLWILIQVGSHRNHITFACNLCCS